jgi:hypothetical protein
VQVTDSSIRRFTRTQAYVRLFFLPASKEGARIVSLARFGNYEIRLLELSTMDYDRDPPLWMELYDHDIPAAIDSCRCGDLEDAVCAAEKLLSQAKQLSEAAEPGV